MSTEQPNNNTTATEEPETTWDFVKEIGGGLLLFGLAYYFFTTMTSYENGEEVTMFSILLLAYNFLGKFIPTGIIALLGGFSLFSGVKGLMGNKE